MYAFMTSHQKCILRVAIKLSIIKKYEGWTRCQKEQAFSTELKQDNVSLFIYLVA